MKYKSVYNKIINSAKRQVRKKTKSSYFEKHHILPRCMGGDDAQGNVILLTAKEHFICHHLLTKMHPKEKTLKVAFAGMCYKYSPNEKRNYKITSTVYENAREQHSIVMSERVVTEETRKRMSKAGKKKVVTPEHRRKMTEGRMKVCPQPALGLKHSPESRAKMSEKQSGKNNAFYGKKHSPESRAKMSKSHSGATITKEQREKQSKTMSSYKWFNNGKTSTRATSCPNGWVEGRMSFNRNRT
jgi:hypothetical protein